MRHASLVYRRRLEAWVEMMRARKAAEVLAEEKRAEEAAEAELRAGVPTPFLEEEKRRGVSALLSGAERRSVAALARAWGSKDEGGVSGTTFLPRRLRSGPVELLSRPRAVFEPGTADPMGSFSRPYADSQAPRRA